MPTDDMHLSCSETPLWIPPLLTVDQLAPCKSCTLSLTAKLAGPGAVVSTANGLSVSENTTVSLSMNGIQYNLVESYLVTPGAHKLPGRQSPCDAEYLLYFNNSLYAHETGIVLCLPIDIGSGPGTAYFKTLDTTVRNDRPTLATLLPEGAQYMSYSGADMKGRSKTNAAPRTLCDPTRRVVSYYVCLTPIAMEAPDFQRLSSYQDSNAYKGPPRPLTDAMKARVLKLVTLIPALTCKGGTGAKDPGVAPKALKCYRIDKDKNIINNKVYVGDQKPPSRTLQDELDGKVEQTTEPPASVQPGDIEYVISIVIAVLAGLGICSLAAYYIWNSTFRGYAKIAAGSPPPTVVVPPTASATTSAAASKNPYLDPYVWMIAGGVALVFLLGALVGALVFG